MPDSIQVSGYLVQNINTGQLHRWANARPTDVHWSGAAITLLAIRYMSAQLSDWLSELPWQSAADGLNAAGPANAAMLHAGMAGQGQTRRAWAHDSIQA